MGGDESPKKSVKDFRAKTAHITDTLFTSVDAARLNQERETRSTPEHQAWGGHLRSLQALDLATPKGSVLGMQWNGDSAEVRSRGFMPGFGEHD